MWILANWDNKDNESNAGVQHVGLSARLCVCLLCFYPLFKAETNPTHLNVVMFGRSSAAIADRDFFFQDVFITTYCVGQPQHMNVSSKHRKTEYLHYILAVHKLQGHEA